MYIFFLRSCSSLDVFVISSLPFMLKEKLLSAWRLCSTRVTLLHSYYTPRRHPLISSPLPSVAGYRSGLSQGISARDKEGFSSCLVCPCNHAVATTPSK